MKLPTYNSQNSPTRQTNATPSGDIMQRSQARYNQIAKETNDAMLKAVDTIQANKNLRLKTKAQAELFKRLNEHYASAESDPDIDSGERYNEEASTILSEVSSTLPGDIRDEFMAQFTPHVTSKQMKLELFNNDRRIKDIELDYVDNKNEMIAEFATTGDTEIIERLTQFVNEHGPIFSSNKAMKMEIKNIEKELGKSRIDHLIKEGDLDILERQIKDDAYGLGDKGLLDDYKVQIETERNYRVQKEKSAEYRTTYNNEIGIRKEFEEDARAYTYKQLMDMADDGEISREFANIMSNISKKEFTGGKADSVLVADWIKDRFNKDFIKQYAKMSVEDKHVSNNAWLKEGLKLVENGAMPLSSYNKYFDEMLPEQLAYDTELYGAMSAFSDHIDAVALIDKGFVAQYIDSLAEDGLLKGVFTGGIKVSRSVIDKMTRGLNEKLSKYQYDKMVKNDPGLAIMGESRGETILGTITTKGLKITRGLTRGRFQDEKGNAIK